MSHTPTPWKLRDGQAITVTQREFGLDCKIMAQGPNTTLANGDFHIASDVTKENAAFIIRACNSHDALASALKTANHVLGILLQSDSGTYAEAQEQIKSALALAK